MIYPIIPHAARNKADDPHSRFCSLNPCCQGYPMKINDVDVPFCPQCFNWLPIAWQEEIYRTSVLAHGWRFRCEKMPTFTIFSWFIKKIVGISYSSPRPLRVKVGLVERPMGSHISWASLKVAPRCEFEDRYSCFLSDPSHVTSLISGLRFKNYEEKGQL